MANRRPRGKIRVERPSQGLSYAVEQGGRLRRHRYLRELRVFLWPTLVAAASQFLIYCIVITRWGRSDWTFIFVAATTMAFIPVASAGILAGLRRHESAIFTATIITLGLFGIAVTILSGARIPVSYQAIFSCLPILLIVMAYSNIRFQRTFRAHVALANFSGADKVASEIGDVRILRGSEEEIGDVELVLIDPQKHHAENWSTLLATCYLRGIEIMPWTKYREIVHGRLDVSSFEISHVAYSPSQLLYARCKRVVDVIVVLLTLPVTVPIAIGTALYIFLRDGGPVIFVQIRRGYGGQRFRMYKFRTMYKGTEGGATGVQDNRIIPGCQLLRKLRFDEIPQLYNILRGDMSLIGPRPVAEYVARSSAIAEPKYDLRTLVLPGITGWAQVRSGYAATTEEEIEKLSYDLYYIKHLSLDLDLLIVFETLKTVVFGTGAR